MPRAEPVRRTPGGHALLNVGCGERYSPEWNNLDLFESEHVRFWDARRGLPYGEGTFDAVYASHVLEHLAPADAERLVAEFSRVLAPGAVCRLAAPDLETICRRYLGALEAAAPGPSPGHLLRYEWAQIELLDQMVRPRSGGRMVELLRAGRFDKVYLKERFGDEFHDYWNDAPPTSRQGMKPRRTLRDRLRRRLTRLAAPFWPHLEHPQFTGEAHKWMWDRLSLRLLLERNGFTGFAVETWQHSRIPEWGRYHLDRSRHGTATPAKPDSIFVEAVKPEP